MATTCTVDAMASTRGVYQLLFVAAAVSFVWCGLVLEGFDRQRVDAHVVASAGAALSTLVFVALCATFFLRLGEPSFDIGCFTLFPLMVLSFAFVCVGALLASETKTFHGYTSRTQLGSVRERLTI